MEFKVGDKYKLIKNCLGEHLNTEITILQEINKDGLIFVRMEYYVLNVEGKVKKSDEYFLREDYLENRINKGNIIKMKGNKDGKK